MTSPSATETHQEYPFPRPDALSVPHEYAQLRGKCPFSHVRLPSGDPAVLVTRYADVKQVLTDPRFSRNIFREEAARLSTTQLHLVEHEAVSDMLDPPGHTRIRKLFAKEFTPRRVDELQPRIEAIVDELVDAMLAAGPPADAVSALAFPLPMQVIGELFGVPREDWQRFRGWADRLFSLSLHTSDEMMEGQVEFAGYIWNLIQARRAEPTGDLFSDLVAVTDAEDGRLSELELIFVAQALLSAGMDSAYAMLARMIGLLLHHPGRYQQLLDDPELVDTAVEEVLRYDLTSSLGIVRFATDDVPIGDTVVSKGTTIVASLAAANRDPEVFDRPEELVIERPDNRHISFGFGMRFCPGAPLARAEMQTLLRTLLRRVPTLELAAHIDELTTREGLMHDPPESLPVRW